jgi:hypothetical protein
MLISLMFCGLGVNPKFRMLGSFDTFSCFFIYKLPGFSIDNARVMVCGQPKRDMQPVIRARATVSAVMSGMGMASGHRVKRSTAVRQFV